MSRLQFAIDQIVFARHYTVRFLKETPEAEWFRITPGGISHVAWQVGHLAMAEYRLSMLRIRGPQPHDGEVLPESYVSLFGKNAPDADARKYPSAADIRAVFDRVHEQALLELPRLSEADLDQPTVIAKPHPYATTKLAALLWCAQHELVHAGQIGLLRRELGHAPLW